MHKTTKNLRQVECPSCKQALVIEAVGALSYYCPFCSFKMSGHTFP